MTPEFDDDILMAYADGALPPDEAARVARAVAADAGLAERVRAMSEAARIVARDLPLPPIPDALAARLAATGLPMPGQAAPAPGDTVVAFRPRATSRPKVTGGQGLALAASLVLALGLGFGLGALRGGPEAAPGDLAALSEPAVLTALSTLPSGESVELAQGGSLTAIATFTIDDGTLCRETEYHRPDGPSLVTVSCRAEGESTEAWNLRLAVVAAAVEDGYLPASSLDALDGWMGATGAGAPMSAPEEAAALGLNPS